MKNLLLALAGVVVASALIGCGGGGAGPGGTGTTDGTTGGIASPYRGTWEGTFADQIPVNGQGTMRVVVDADGKYTVQARNNTTARDITGSGTISGSGQLSGSVTNGNTQATVTGTVTLGQAGSQLTGHAYLTTAQGNTSQLNVTLAKQ